MTSLGTDFEMHAIWQGYIEDPAAKVFVARKACTIALCKAQGLWNQPNSRVGNPLGIPSRTVLHSLAGLMSCKKVSVQGFLWVRKVWFTFAQWMFAPEIFSKRQKLSYFEKPCMLCMKFWGARTTYYLTVPKVRETGRDIGFLFSQERVQ
jgi:hypothetical protein